MPFEIRVRKIEERVEIIKARAKEARENNRTEPFYDYSSALDPLPVIEVPSDLLLYRLDNARTKSWQLSYLEARKGEISEKFFSSPENVAAQKVQHEQLLKLAQKRVDDDPSIYSVLEDERRQTERLLITSDGVVLNGNRRLAAMRELSSLEPPATAISAFRNVSVLVLPAHLGESDLLDIEGRLQVAPDLRMPYDWTDEALLIESMRNENIDDSHIAKILRKKDKNAVLAILEQFNEGKLYLAESLHEPKNYAAIVPHEENFRQLTRAIKKASSEEKEISRLLCWAITKHADDAERRLYDYRILYGPKRLDALDEFVRRNHIDLSTSESTHDGDDDDLFDDGDNGNAGLLESYAVAIDALKNEERSKEVAASLRDIGDFFIDIQDDDKAKSHVLRKAQRALVLLEQAAQVVPSAETHQDVRLTLDDIDRTTARIRGSMDADVAEA